MYGIPCYLFVTPDGAAMSTPPSPLPRPPYTYLDHARAYNATDEQSIQNRPNRRKILDPQPLAIKLRKFESSSFQCDPCVVCTVFMQF